jgi:hypothetical protein
VSGSTAPSLTTYAGLTSAVAAWLMRDPSDPDIQAVIPLWVQLAEAEFTHDSPLGLTETLVRKRLSTEFDQLPNDFVQVMEVFYVGTGQCPTRRVIPYSTREGMARHHGHYGREPLNYTIIGNLIQFGPCFLDPFELAVDPHWFEMQYRARVPRLGSNDGDSGALITTNDILVNHPSIYLYGTLVQAAPYIGADARLAMWQARYSDALAKASARSITGRTGRIEQKVDENVGYDQSAHSFRDY